MRLTVIQSQKWDKVELALPLSRQVPPEVASELPITCRFVDPSSCHRVACPSPGVFNAPLPGGGGGAQELRTEEANAAHAREVDRQPTPYPPDDAGCARKHWFTSMGIRALEAWTMAPPPEVLVGCVQAAGKLRANCVPTAWELHTRCTTIERRSPAAPRGGDPLSQIDHPRPA